MERDWKTASAAVIAVISLLGGVITIVSLAVSISGTSNIFGTYVGENGSEMTLEEDGTYIDVAAPVYLQGNWGQREKYEICGDTIRVGSTEYKIQDDGTVMGRGAVWTKRKMKPDRPSDLAGTYVWGHELMISLDKSGAAYFQRVSPDSSRNSIWVELWAAKDGKIEMTVPDYSTNSPQIYFLNMNGTNLVYENITLSKYSDEVIIPVAK
ncbi:MAG: hypothetical protein JXA49_03070 [Actinobacteria bacterium]|nr:hypothetical protein [Actinomycetota bacterium]